MLCVDKICNNCNIPSNHLIEVQVVNESGLIEPEWVCEGCYEELVKQVKAPDCPWVKQLIKTGKEFFGK